MQNHRLVVEQLGCHVGSKPLFENISFQINSGNWLEVVGANGVGKTTLLRTVCGLSEPTSGKVYWADQAQLSIAQRCVFQGHLSGFKDALTVSENLLLQLELDAMGFEFNASKAEKQIALNAVLKTVGLDQRSQLRFGALSAGQKRRCAIARLSLCHTVLTGIKWLWILDEPLNALDANGQVLLAQTLFQHLKAGGSAMVCTHQSLVPLLVSLMKGVDSPGELNDVTRVSQPANLDLSSIARAAS